MEKPDKKIKEPFEPKDTPKPPQIIDPNTGRERENPVEGEGNNKDPEKNNKASAKKKPHLLSDEADLDDETTI